MASQQEIVNTLLGIGASPQEAQVLSAIAMAESGGNAGALNDSGIETSAGWFQINTDVHPLSIQQAQDPVTGAQYALNLYRQQGPRPWSVTHGNNPPYLQYMGSGAMPPGQPQGPTPQGPPLGAGETADPVHGPNGELLGYNVYPSGYDKSNPYETRSPRFVPASESGPQVGTAGNPSVSHSTSQSQSTSFSQSISQYIPNAVDKINAIINGINSAIDAGDLDLKKHIAAFDAVSTQVAHELDVLKSNATLGQNAAISQQQLQQVADQQKLDAARAQMEDERVRQSTNVERGLRIGEERGRAAQSFVSDFLPNAIPGGISALNIPLVGQVFPNGLPVNQVNPDDVYNIAGLNNIPVMPGQSSVPLPQPSAVAPIPTGQIAPIDPTRYPQIPTGGAPSLPGMDFASLMGMLTGQF